MSSLTQRLSASQKPILGQTLSPQMQRTMHLLQLPQDELEREVADICDANPLIAEQPTWSRKGAHRNQIADWSATTAAPVTLTEHLTGQLALSGASVPVRAAAASIIEHIAPTGRLPVEDWDRLSRTPQATAALQLVQSFEPTGVGARSLGECFALQLDEARAASPAWQALLANLGVLANEPAHALAKRCGISASVLSTMIAHLRTLDPHPGHRFDLAERVEITPDLRAVQSESGEWVVALTFDPGTAFTSEPAYRGWQRDKSLGASARAFLQDKRDEADWLQRALRQRGQTLLRVAGLAVNLQDRFLCEGPEHVSPLTMREIATRLELHESTVSRAVANKYILTPRGALPLRSFFSTALSDSFEHSETSSAAVRARIAVLIQSEHSPGSMSDRAISDALNQNGITIARRSVAKHREHLGLGCARERARLASYAIAAE